MYNLAANLFMLLTLGVMFGLCVGIGIAVGMEIVMRLSGEGRTVILTMARNISGKAEDRG